MASQSRTLLNSLPPDIRKVMAPVFKRLEILEKQAASIGGVTKPLEVHLDANGNTVTGLRHAIMTGEAVPFDQMQQYVEAALKQKGL